MLPLYVRLLETSFVLPLQFPSGNCHTAVTRCVSNKTFPTKLHKKLAIILKIYIKNKKNSLNQSFNLFFNSSGARTTLSSSKSRSKCTYSVDPFPVYSMGPIWYSATHLDIHSYCITRLYTSKLFSFPTVSSSSRGSKNDSNTIKDYQEGVRGLHGGHRGHGGHHGENKERVDRGGTL